AMPAWSGPLPRPMVFQLSAPAPCDAVYEMPHCCASDELHQLLQKRQHILTAIAQVEQELARVVQQQRLQQCHTVSADTVHLMTEQFEAHCNAMRCLPGQPHRIRLEGGVRLTWKNGGHPVHIETACVVINTRDSTFAVE